ncbi:MAG: alpha/beta hydrolase family protein [Pyrinomonadaceae bacterium]
MKLFALSATCLCLFLFARTVARAQGDLQEAKGAFVTYVAGREAARESYFFAPEPDRTLRAEGEITPEGGATQKLVTVATRAQPLSFTAETGGAQIYSATFSGGTIKIHAAGKPDTEVPTRATVVLENIVWHQFHFLFAQYDAARGGAQKFTCFLPSQQIDFGVTVERVGSQEFTVGGYRMPVDHYRLVNDQKITIEAWVGSGRIPLLFYIPAARIRGVRVGYEELEKFALVEAKKASEYHPPDYAAPSAFAEREVTVGEGTEWALPATLSMPKGKGLFPVVVLVHGSGANDRDETVLASKPFRDLAYGLASQGIAVLRYDKRTLVHGAKFVAAFPNFTVKEETLDDALAAVALLRRTPGVDPKRVFVLGHSLGGMLVPRVGAGDPRIRGLVVMAGPTTPLEDAFVRQYEYLLGLDGSLSDDDRKLIADIKRQTDRVKQLTAADLSSKEMLHGVPPSYWLDLRAHDPVATARRLKRPILVIQGERDYNVTLTDFRGWQRLAATRRNVTTKSYPKLDHLFLEGEEPSTGAQYAVPRNIPRYVIDDVAAFVKRH